MIRINKGVLTVAVAALAGLGGTATASAATGYTCLTNTASCASPYSGTLFANDPGTATGFDAKLSTSTGAITCTKSFADGTITSAGPGPVGYLANIAFQNTSGGTACPTTFSALGNPTATTTALDTTTGAGVWAVSGDKSTNTMTINNPLVRVVLGSVANCYYSPNGATSGTLGNVVGTVSGNTLTIAGQTMTSTAAAPAGQPAKFGPCPTPGTFAATYNLATTAAGTTPVYLTA